MHPRYAHPLLALLPFALIASTVAAQPYYAFSQADEAYTEITDGTPITFVSGWAQITSFNGQYLPLTGGSFALGGARQCWVCEAGFVNFDVQSISTVFISALFTNFGGLVPADASASVTAALHGPEDAREFIIQWKNYRRNDGQSGDYVNFQVYIHQATGVIEVRYGPHDDGGATYTSETGPNAGYYFANYDASTIHDRIWLSGNASTPSISTAQQASFTGLTSIPDDGTVYRFTPTWTVGIAEADVLPASFYISTDGTTTVHFRDAANTGTITVRDMLGRTLLTVRKSADLLTLPDDLPAEAMLVEYDRPDGGREVVRFVHP